MIEKQNFLQVNDLSTEEIEHIFDRAKFIKDKFKAKKGFRPLVDRTLVLIFEKQSTRTRLSFEAGMQQMGGNTVLLNNADSQLGRGEPIKDSARVISSMSDIIMIRTFEHSVIEEFANYSSVPIINGLTNQHHPCQILADIFTFQEKRGTIRGKQVAWIGDSNNVCASWMQAALILNFTLNVSSPPGFGIDLKDTQFSNQNLIKQFEDPKAAAKDVDLIVTDVWTSMGFESEVAERTQSFKAWQVNQEILGHAKKNAIFMHCLPAHRGEEVTAEVIEGPKSVVWEEAENRLHTQKALLEVMLLGKLR